MFFEFKYRSFYFSSSEKRQEFIESAFVALLCIRSFCCSMGETKEVGENMSHTPRILNSYQGMKAFLVIMATKRQSPKKSFPQFCTLGLPNNLLHATLQSSRR